MSDEREQAIDDEDEEVAARAAVDPEKFLSITPHFYRGEVSLATTAQDRIDRTTDWAVALIAAILSLVFSSPDMPAYLLLIGVFVLSVFLLFEVRRYRMYDVARARIRLIEQNLFANTFDPAGVEHPNWREEMSEDLRSPAYKVSRLEAFSRRIRRVYGLLFVIVGVAWVGKVTLFTPEVNWREAAELPGVDGLVVTGVLALFYALVAVFALWPTDRKAMGEIYREESGDWKTDEER